jgi:hypothetical protein
MQKRSQLFICTHNETLSIVPRMPEEPTPGVKAILAILPSFRGYFPLWSKK